ncbi:uncharacterized protein METZ01_LOCUS469810, partial [marine metagenome]
TYTERSTTSHAITEFDPTIENWFWVQVTDTLGLSSIGWGMSNELDSEPAPVNVTDVTYDLESITITWEEYSPNMGRIAGMNLSTGSTVVNDFSSYELLQSDSENGTYTSVIVITDQSIISHSITEFDPLVENWFKVKVTDVWGLTSTGNGMTNYLETEPPGSVDVHEVYYDIDSMTVRWDQSNAWDFASYELLYSGSEDGEYMSIVVIDGIYTTSYSITEFDPNINNWFKIKVTDYWGLSTIGNPLS